MVNATIEQVLAKVGELTVVNSLLEARANRADELETEVIRLQRLCIDKGIDIMPPEPEAEPAPTPAVHKRTRPQRARPKTLAAVKP